MAKLSKASADQRKTHCQVGHARRAHAHKMRTENETAAPPPFANSSDSGVAVASARLGAFSLFAMMVSCFARLVLSRCQCFPLQWRHK
eukprot:6176817-Pleurochrysis_carterae.AAC.3